jgi:hypothetical protein
MPGRDEEGISAGKERALPPVHLARLDEQAVLGQQTTAVHAQPQARARVDHEDAQVGMDAEVRDQRVVRVRRRGESQQMPVDRLDEPRRAGEQRCPRAPLGVQRSGDGEPLRREDRREPARDLGRDDAADAVRVVAGVPAALDLDLARVVLAHAVGTPERPAV